MAAESLAFREWLLAEDLVRTAAVDEFEDAVVGFDAEDYINMLLSRELTREPLLPALGGLPFALTDHIDRDLDQMLAQFRKPPMFIFNGLDVAVHDSKMIAKEGQKAVKILDEAWSVYDQGRGDAAVEAFGKTCTYRTWHIVRYLYYYLHKKGAKVMTAPYSAAAQLAYFDEERYVSCAFGSAALLVYNVDQVILNFDWDSKEVSFVMRDEVLQKLMINHTQLVDLLLLSGSCILPPIPEIDTGTEAPKIPAARQVLNRAGQDGHMACLQAKDEEYLAQYRKARAAVKHMVLLKANGKIEQLNADQAPNDSHEFIGTRLPDEVFGYLKNGLVSSRALNWRCRKEIFESPPLDGGKSTAYKDLVQAKLNPLRLRSLALLSSRLHRYFYKKDVDVVCWFNESEERPLGIPDLQLDNVGKDAESWHVRDKLRKESKEAKSLELNDVPIQYAIALLSDDATARKTVTKRAPPNEHSVLKSPAELLSNTMWRFLQDRGYINSDHTLSAWGKALKAAFERATADGYLGQTDPAREAEEAIFIAFELLRLDMLNTKNMFPSPPYTGGPARGDEQDKANTLLLTRIATLGTFKHDNIGFTGPLSRHTLAYHQVAAAVRHSLRDLVEVHALNMMLNGSAVRIRNDEEYADVGSRLPFLKEPDLGLALVVKSHLDELCQPKDKRTDIRKWFNHALDIDADIQRAWKMWDSINAGVQAADSAIVSSETRDMFQSADVWLSAKRLESTSLSSTNGTNGVA